MKNLNPINYIILGCCVLLLLMACKKDKEEVLGLSIKEANYMSAGNYMGIRIKATESIQLTALLTPGNRETKDVLYTHKYPDLLSISATGLLVGKSAGRDTLTVSLLGRNSLPIHYVVDISNP